MKSFLKNFLKVRRLQIAKYDTEERRAIRALLAKPNGRQGETFTTFRLLTLRLSSLRTLQNVQLENRIRDIVNAVIDIIKDNLKDEPFDLYLFGSRIHEGEALHSDIDLALSAATLSDSAFRNIKRAIDDIRTLYSIDLIRTDMETIGATLDLHERRLGDLEQRTFGYRVRDKDDEQ